jgi:hypothetical protein
VEGSGRLVAGEIRCYSLGLGQRQVDRLDLAGPAPQPGRATLRSVAVVVGEDLERLAMLGHEALPDLAYALPDLLGGHDPELTALEFLHEHRCAGRVAVASNSRGIEMTLLLPTRRTFTIFTTSIYADSRVEMGERGEIARQGRFLPGVVEEPLFDDGPQVEATPADLPRGDDIAPRPVFHGGLRDTEEVRNLGARHHVRGGKRAR